MRLLFISSGRNGSVSNIVKNQGESIKKAGLLIDYYPIKPGIWGYFMSIFKIRKTFRNGNYDLVHAHYILSGFVASFAGCRPLVVSLMGTDVYISGILRIAARYFCKNRWDATIVKTVKMKELLKVEKVLVIPNGVDIERFKPIDEAVAKSYINYNQERKLILFISAKHRPEKNIELAIKAVKKLNDSSIEFRHIHDVPNSEIPSYLNAADLLLLTSKREGSVNIVKEAMACNCPLVSTDVGDVKWIISDTQGCYLTSFDPLDISEKIKEALNFRKRTNGLDRIVALKLDSDSIAHRILQVYQTVLKKN